MLVLRRKPNQALTIGNDVRVVVLSIDGDSVRLGVEAPRSVSVRRAERDGDLDEPLLDHSG